MAFLYVANWKMAVSYDAAKQFCTQHGPTLEQLTHKSSNKLVLCPSFLALSMFSTMAKEGTLILGAQDCSPFPSGAHTGDVDALSLKQLGCSYCIVGHSERRLNHQETNEVVAQKVAQLQLNGITPIVCVGETAAEKNNNETFTVLQKQLAPVLTVSAATQGPLIIAYEPIWAVGSGLIPMAEEIAQVAQAIDAQLRKSLSQSVPILYGGGVTPNTIAMIRAVPGIKGVMIGSASTDFHSLEKIVS